MKNEQVHELLYEALETEMGGVQVYKTAIECALNEELKEEWTKYLEQTKNHERIIRQLLGQFKLDPDFVYLRVTRGKHVGLLWRGNIERTPAGDTEVYYSGSGEVVRLRHGLVVGALGTNTEWRRVEMPTPQWAAVAAAGESQPFERVRDVMPGYRTGVRDRLVMKVIAAPSSTSSRERKRVP